MCYRSLPFFEGSKTYLTNPVLHATFEPTAIAMTPQIRQVVLMAQPRTNQQLVEGSRHVLYECEMYRGSLDWIMAGVVRRAQDATGPEDDFVRNLCIESIGLRARVLNGFFRPDRSPQPDDI